MGKMEATLLARPREGLAKIREAIHLSPGHTELLELLTEVYGPLGRHDDAARELTLFLGEAAPDLPRPKSARSFSCSSWFASASSHGGRRRPRRQRADCLHRPGHGPAGSRPEGVSAPQDPLGQLRGSRLAFVAARKHRRTPARCRSTRAGARAVHRALRDRAEAPAHRSFYPGSLAAHRLEKRASHPLRVTADRFARAFGELRFDLYVDAPSVSAPRLMPGEIPAIVLPRGYADLSENEQAVGLARSSSTSRSTSPGSTSSGATISMASSLARCGSSTRRTGGPALSRQGGQRGTLPSAHRQSGQPQAPPHARRASSHASLADFDASATRAALRIAGFRGAYVLTGDIVTTLNHVLRVDRDLAQAPKAQRIRRCSSTPLRSTFCFMLSRIYPSRSAARLGRPRTQAQARLVAPDLRLARRADAIELVLVGSQVEAVPARNFVLQRFDARLFELGDAVTLDADEVVVVSCRRRRARSG